MTQFKDLGLAEPILRAIDAAGYSTPTPIQKDVIPAIQNGQDVIGIAQTGTGKTAAFVLPILNQIVAQKKRPAPKTCGALIITPTRELAAQIVENIQIYSKFIKASSAVIVGGVKPGPQIKALSRGVDIIVATPGRLLDHLQTGAISLKQTTQVVADEADQMMDMGFLPSIRKIMQALPQKRQTLLLSATMPPQIKKLAIDFMPKPIEISVAPASKPIERITQIVKRVEKSEKKNALIDILNSEEIERVVIFTRTKHGANKLVTQLQKANHEALAIHGNKSQSQREKALAAFKAGQVRILVATDIAARGIDIDDVSHVINYELPNIPESYVHRIGRTARAGRSGVAISLCDREEVAYLRDIEKLTKQSLLEKSPEEEAREQARNSGKRTGPARANTGGNKRPSRNRRRKSTQSERPKAEGTQANRSKKQGPRSDQPRSAKPKSRRPQGNRSQGNRSQGNRPQNNRSDGGMKRAS